MGCGVKDKLKIKKYNSKNIRGNTGVGIKVPARQNLKSTESRDNNFGYFAVCHLRQTT